MESDFHRLLGTPQAGGILIVSDHASNRVPEDIDLGIDPALLQLHIAIDIGVGAIAEQMVSPGTAAWLGNVSRLVCDYNRKHDVPGMMPEISDGHVIPGNVLTPHQRHARVTRFFEPYHSGLATLLHETPPALILSLHSFTPGLATCDKPRPWQIGILYNEDERAARIAIPWLEAQGFVVGDQEPYSGKLLNASMNRHAEPNGLPYLSIEIRQDLIADAAGQAEWARVMSALSAEVVNRL
ncbi:N-formylglutamate amidohydrolase [Novosphingobium barchaimii LL02]|uniref:N-formylglutamate amidohydrolase n=1 Tax=Novosphingobium barchaimii LL02 TaxID=1114963 RepID=A0A0J7Y733_9SPHN|nr:N-formylglutamate amidohydrolase [Novosphingobium barchaimii]KMS59754.1 N-formylglutamate amidohydrolase [Novosphingobium barchaimii LL02]